MCCVYNGKSFKYYSTTSGWQTQLFAQQCKQNWHAAWNGMKIVQYKKLKSTKNYGKFIDFVLWHSHSWKINLVRDVLPTYKYNSTENNMKSPTKKNNGRPDMDGDDGGGYLDVHIYKKCSQQHVHSAQLNTRNRFTNQFFKLPTVIEFHRKVSPSFIPLHCRIAFK